MLAHVAQRALEELDFARSTLTGDVPLKNLPLVPQAKDEEHLRRVVAVPVIDRLSSLLADVASITEDTDRLVRSCRGVGPMPAIRAKETGFSGLLLSGRRHQTPICRN
jgi:hypothetical protein